MYRLAQLGFSLLDTIFCREDHDPIMSMSSASITGTIGLVDFQSSPLFKPIQHFFPCSSHAF